MEMPKRGPLGPATPQRLQSLCSEAAEFFCNACNRILEFRQTLHQLALLLVFLRLLLRYLLAFPGILQGPRPPLLGIEGLRLDHIFERAEIFLEIENAMRMRK